MKTNQKHIWMILKRVGLGDVPYDFEFYRDDARKVAKYLNGFSHGTRDAKYRVKKYKEAE